MSCYFDIKMKMKGRPVSEAPTLFTLCTTPARELASKVDLVFDADNNGEEYTYWTILDTDTLNSIIRYYEDEVNSFKQSIQEYKTQIDENREMLPKASTIEIFNAIRDDINDLASTLAWAEEELEMQEYRLYDFNHLKAIIDDNPNFELVYYLG